MCIYKTYDGKCKKFSDDKITSYCVNAPCKYEKLSNYDRIRNMSIDEIAALLIEEHEYGVAHETYYICPGGKHFEEGEYNKAFEYTIQWLESEVE